MQICATASQISLGGFISFIHMQDEGALLSVDECALEMVSHHGIKGGSLCEMLQGQGFEHLHLRSHLVDSLLSLIDMCSQENGCENWAFSIEPISLDEQV